jgi:NMD protein affecting ribosome stability and mRNA decay
MKPCAVCGEPTETDSDYSPVCHKCFIKKLDHDNNNERGM